MPFLIQTYVIKIIKENLIHRTFQEFLEKFNIDSYIPYINSTNRQKNLGKRFFIKILFTQI